MTGLRVIEAALWAACAAGLAAVALAVGRPAVGKPSLEPVQYAVMATPPPPRVASESATALVVSRDLFRPSRRPAPERFQRTVTDVADAEAEEVVRPALTLVGIVMGREPSAIIEGWPGAEGARVMRAGEREGALVVKRIRGGTVEIAGMDTLWVLTMREPWQ